jgi:hypothetical protein
MIISNCGYQSFHVDHPEDVLLCFQEIINLHRLVVQTWNITCTHFSGPVVEYIIEKALPVFPCLLDLDVSGTVKFYDGLQKISMRYLLPLMPFDSISLSFGYEGLCPPGFGTTRYSAIASAWMDVLPRLLPLKDSEVESAIFSVWCRFQQWLRPDVEDFGTSCAGIQVYESGSGSSMELRDGCSFVLPCTPPILPASS